MFERIAALLLQMFERVTALLLQMLERVAALLLQVLERIDRLVTEVVDAIAPATIGKMARLARSILAGWSRTQTRGRRKGAGGLVIILLEVPVPRSVGIRARRGRVGGRRQVRGRCSTTGVGGRGARSAGRQGRRPRRRRQRTRGCVTRNRRYARGEAAGVARRCRQTARERRSRTRGGRRHARSPSHPAYGRRQLAPQRR